MDLSPKNFLDGENFAVKQTIHNLNTMEAAASMCSHGGDHLPASNNGIAAGASIAAAAGSYFVSGDVDKDGHEPVPPSSSSSHAHFDLSQTFMSLRTLLAAAEAFAKAGGWIIKY
eukprot:scaffold24435_cov96-Skeletonema_marinoi.AAC.5